MNPQPLNVLSLFAGIGGLVPWPQLARAVVAVLTEGNTE